MYARDVESALAAAAQNRYWREAEAQMVVSLWQDSGQTLSAFGRQFGINVARLRRWRRRLADQELPTFHPLCVVPDAAVPTVAVAGAGAGIELVLAGGRRIVVQPGFDEATLARVVRSLEALAC